MRRTVFLAIASLVCGLGVSAQQHNIDTQKSTLTIHVGIRAHCQGWDTNTKCVRRFTAARRGSHPAVQVHVDARALRVTDKDDSEKNRAEVQKTMLGPEVLASEHHEEIV